MCLEKRWGIRVSAKQGAFAVAAVGQIMARFIWVQFDTVLADLGTVLENRAMCPNLLCRAGNLTQDEWC